ncbi:MAG: hypothetical protein ABIP95_12445 [Pelobium sp.]
MGQKIETGNHIKVEVGVSVINFNMKFNKIPTLVISSYMENEQGIISEMKTQIYSTSKYLKENLIYMNQYGFTIENRNPEYNYYVNWIALEVKIQNI